MPYARALSGVQIRGNAADWWGKAKGRYVRSGTPDVGSVLVIGRNAHLRHGHLAVVSRLVSSRRILVTHANWVRRRVSVDVPVIDVSAGNDWSAVRVWWPPTNSMGIRRYPVSGFIHPVRLSSLSVPAASGYPFRRP